MACRATWTYIFLCWIYFPNLNSVLSSSMHPFHSYSGDGIRPKNMSTLKVALLFHGPLARGVFQKRKSIFLKEIPSISSDIQALCWSFGRLQFLKSLITKLVSCGYKIIGDECLVRKCSASVILKSLEGVLDCESVVPWSAQVMSVWWRLIPVIFYFEVVMKNRVTLSLNAICAHCCKVFLWAML